MSLLFCDSFDHYATADIPSKWTTYASGNTTIDSGSGRRSTNSMRCSAGQGATKSGFNNPATIIFGAAVRVTNPASGNSMLVAFLDGGTTHVSVGYNTAGNILVYRGTTTSGTLLGTSVNAISSATVFYLEVKVTISDTVGVVEVRVNGSNSGWHNITGADTRNGATAQINGVQILGGASTPCFWDDLYICDTAGSAPNNDFLGDVRVDTYLPNGNGNSSQLTGSDGNSTDNYLLVDEASQDGDTSYVQSATASQKDTYAFSNMSHTPATIHGVQINMFAKKDDAGARSICSVIRSGGSDTDGTTQALSTSYVDYREIAETDPDTAAAWDKAGFDAAEFGVKVAA